MALVVTAAWLAACDREVATGPSPAGPVGTADAPEGLRASNDEAGKLHRIAEEYFDRYLELNPLRATELGDHRYDDRYGDYASPSWMADSLGIEQESLEKLAAVDPGQLSGEELVTYAAFKRQREINIAGYRYPTELLPIDPFLDLPGEFATLGSGLGAHPFRTTRDYDNFLKRMDGFVAWVEQAINNMRAGVTKGVVLPRVVVERALPRLDAIAGVEDPRASVFWRPLLSFPAAPSVADRRRLLQAYEQKLRTQVLPAYRRLRDYLARDYLPQARLTVGWSALPGGEFWYAQLVQQYTSAEVTPEEAHELGLREVARLRVAVDVLRSEPGGASSGRVPARAQPGQANPPAADPRQLLGRYAALHARIAPRLPSLFARVPQATLEFRAAQPMPGDPPVWYRPPGSDGGRPGVLYVDTRAAPSSAAWFVEAQYLHEAVPGRHLQAALAREAQALPRFRRFGTDPAFVEGWAAYAATLGDELDAYVEPEARVGIAAMALTRAARMVVDTGVHARGWSRQQAIDYLRTHTMLDESASALEVDRCIAQPGAGLAGPVGERKILDLRRRAEAQLGADFDLREFHEQVVGGGALPLPVLELKLRRWMERRRR